VPCRSRVGNFSSGQDVPEYVGGGNDDLFVITQAFGSIACSSFGASVNNRQGRIVDGRLISVVLTSWYDDTKLLHHSRSPIPWRECVQLSCAQGMRFRIGDNNGGENPERDAMTLGSLVGRPAFTGT
jgi:hypothetical protein